ncbi:MAG: cupin domain-containing protein [Chloroflexi bacterium]|nr:cupin domain-containing protein [Chloroflexota bacterium]
MTGYAKIIVLKPGEGRQPAVTPNMIQTIKVAGEDVSGEFALWESEIKGGPGPHIHHNDIETFYVLEGEVEYRLGDEVAVLGKGGFLLIPRGQVHSFQTVGDDPAKLLVMVLPAGFEHFFEEMAAMQANGVEITEALKVAGEKFNTTFLPPE